MDIVDELDTDEFSVHEIDSIVEDLGNDGHKVMFYHFLKPDTDLDYGLQPLGSDQDVLFMAKYVEEGHKLIDIYVEHEKTNPDLYFTSPLKHKRVVIEQIEDDEHPSRAGITPVARKLVIDVNKVQSSGVEKNVEPYVVRVDEGQSSMPAVKDTPSQGNSAFVNEFYSSYDPYVESQDPNFDPFADLDSILPQNDTQQVEMDDLVADAVVSEGHGVDTEVSQDHGVDTVVSEGHGYDTEVSEGVNDDVETSEGHGDDAETSEGSKVTDSSDDDSQDSDYIVDEENYVEEVDVDMEDFRLNIDETVEFMGCKNKDEATDEGEIEDDVEVLNNEYFESATDEEDELDSLRRRKLKQIRKQAHASPQVYKTFFYVGKKFPNRDEVKELVKEHSIETRRELRMEKNDKERVRVVCRGIIPTLPTFEPTGSDGPANGPASVSDGNGSKVKSTQTKVSEPTENPSTSKQKMTKERLVNGGRTKSKKVDRKNKCPWVLLISKHKDSQTWEVKTHNSSHKCLQSRNILYATSKWYAKELAQQLESNPKIPVRAVQEQLQRTYELSVSESKAFRAKAEAEKKVVGDYTQQYKMLRDYCLELQQANPNTTVKIQVRSEADHTVPTRVFRRIYVCLGPLKEGFKAGMRDVLGLDGAFMKGPFPGQLLTAVSIDPNNGIYPLAYGIVETENTDSWTWFLYGIFF